MSARDDAAGHYGHVAWLLHEGKPLPPDYAAWLADRLADVARVLADGRNAKPDAAVMVALGARRAQQRGGATAERDRQLAERVEHHRRENPGRPLKAIYQDVADEWPLWRAERMLPEFERIADGLRVSSAVVRAAHQKPKPQ